MPKIYIDTGDLEKIKQARRSGIIEGVTTNPILIKQYLEKSKICFLDYIIKLLEESEGLQLFIQPIAENAEDFVSKAREFYRKYSKGKERDIVIKVPLIINRACSPYDGLIALRTLSKEGIKVNASAIMSPEQAALASRAGACYVALFTGNVDDFIRKRREVKFSKEDYYGKAVACKYPKICDKGVVCGEDLVDKTIRLFEYLQLSSKIVIAGIRNRRAFREALDKKVEMVTAPPNVLEEIINHPKTLEFSSNCYNSGSWFGNG